MSLLRNTGKGRFQDLTVPAGLAEPIASQSAAWGDFDNDGKLDLYVVGEYRQDRPDRSQPAAGSITIMETAPSPTSPTNPGSPTKAGPRERPGATTTTTAGSTSTSRTCGAPTASTATRATAPSPTSPRKSGSPIRSTASRAGSGTIDNDGKLDLFVCGYFARLNDVVVRLPRASRPRAERPRLYHNLGDGRFEDVTAATGLDRVMLPMGTNFADIDNDGFLDMYLGTGIPPTWPWCPT